MANPYSSACAASGKAKMRAIGGKCRASGGVVQSNPGIAKSDSGDSAGKDIMTALSPAYMAYRAISGKKSGGRAGKLRGDKGGVHKKTKLNVSAAAAPAMAMPDVTAMPPPGMSSGPMPVPGAIKRGGFVKRASGGRIGYPISAGAETGKGRLQLARSQKRK